MTRANQRRFPGAAAAVDVMGRSRSKEPHYHNRTASTWDCKYIQTHKRVFDETGRDRACARPADELSMERTMCRKKRGDRELIQW